MILGTERVMGWCTCTHLAVFPSPKHITTKTMRIKIRITTMQIMSKHDKTKDMVYFSYGSEVGPYHKECNFYLPVLFLSIVSILFISVNIISICILGELVKRNILIRN